MAIAVAQVAHVSSIGGVGNPSVTLTSATTVGNRLLVTVAGFSTPGATTGSIVDNKGNTFTLDYVSPGGFSGIWVAVYSAPIVTGGATHTVSTPSGGGYFANLGVAEVSGLATSSVLDKTAGNTAVSSTWTTGSTGTLTAADEIAVVVVSVDAGGISTITQAAGFTLIGENEDGANLVSNAAYSIVATTTAINHAWTETFGTVEWVAAIATYKAPAGPPTLVVADGAHAHTADGPITLVVPGVFIVQDAAHAHTADQVPFPPQAIPANASHAHTADNVPSSSALYSDDFNRANGPLGSNWVFDTGGYVVSSNRALCSASGFATFNSPNATADMFVEADVITWDVTYTVINGRTTPALRGVAAYQAYVVPTGGSGSTTRTLTIAKVVGGAGTDLASTSISTPNSAGFKLRLEMQGTALRAYVDGVLALSTTDASITTGNYAGIDALGGAPGSGGTYDNWATGPIGIPPVTLTVANGAHAHVADNITLSLGFLVNDALHAHTADVVLLPATLTISDGGHAHIATQINLARFLYPVGVQGKKLIDQTGGIYILNDFSSWAMMNNLTNAQITYALEGLAARHFSCVMTGLGIGDDNGVGGWHKYTNATGQPFFATVAGGSTMGNPIKDPLGSAWQSLDWIITECTRLGLTLMYSLVGGVDHNNGITGAMINCTVAENYTFGQRLAQRLIAYPNVIWHLEWEGGWSPASPEGQRADAFYHAVSDTHTAAGRPGQPLIFAEQGANGYAGGFVDDTGWNWMKCVTGSLYQYFPNSVERFDTAQGEVPAYGVWDCEPSYIGANQYSTIYTGTVPLSDPQCRQNWRERNYAVLIRGGVGINFGDEAWWPFGASGLYSTPWVWQDVPTNVTSYEAQYCWDLLIAPTICQDPTWRGDNSFLVAGLGSGDTKAAVGRGAHCAVAYFPNNSRTVTVNTTLVASPATSYITPSISVATTPDQTAFFPTPADFCIVAKVRKPVFGAVSQMIASQAGATAATDAGWGLLINSAGSLLWEYSTNGLGFGGQFGTIPGSTWSGLNTGDPMYVAFSFDDNTSTYTYGGYWSLDGVTWTGPTGGGTSGTATPAFFNSASPVRIGSISATNGSPFGNGIDWVEMRSGLTPTTGSIIWRFDAADWVSGTSWTDARGHTWTITTAGAITDVPAVPVRLRWYDPVLGTFTNIAVGEAPTSARSVSFPSGSHSDTNTDWVLVVDDRADLGVNDATHGHTADNAAITVPFSVNDANHAVTSTPITLTVGLLVNDGAHAHIATTINIGSGLTVDSAAHGHVADGNLLLGAGILAVADALHGHRADNVDVAQPGVVNSAFHAHIATHIILTVVAISKVRLGSVTPQSMKLGTAPVTRAYLGSNQVF